MADIDMRLKEARAALEEIMEEAGGELTEETAEYLDYTQQLEAIETQIKEEFMQLPDEYAAWYKNVEAERNMIQAEKNAYLEEMKKIVAKYDARINSKEADMAWIKMNIEAAMRSQKIEKLDKKVRPESLFSLWFQKSQSLEINEEVALWEYRGIQKNANADCPEWLEFVPKIKKAAIDKKSVLPEGFTLVTKESLQIR